MPMQEDAFKGAGYSGGSQTLRTRSAARLQVKGLTTQRFFAKGTARTVELQTEQLS